MKPDRDDPEVVFSPNRPGGILGPLFDAPAAEGPAPTSKAAARRIGPRIGGARLKVLRYIAERGPRGTTLDEMVRATGTPVNSLSGRFTELGNADRRRPWEPLIAPDGERPTRTGALASVWKLTDAGHAFLRLVREVAR